jgi:hypothetical protein
VRFLTPALGSNSPAITTRSRSTCPTDAHPEARPTCNIGGLHRELEHLIAMPGPIDLATLRPRPTRSSLSTCGTRPAAQWPSPGRRRSLVRADDDRARIAHAELHGPHSGCQAWRSRSAPQ